MTDVSTCAFDDAWTTLERRWTCGRDGKRQYIVLDPRCAEKHTLIHEVTSLNSKTIIFENVFRFYTPLVCYTSISDQTEMSTLTLIWQLWLEQI